MWLRLGLGSELGLGLMSALGVRVTFRRGLGCLPEGISIFQLVLDDGQELEMHTCPHERIRSLGVSFLSDHVILLLTVFNRDR